VKQAILLRNFIFVYIVLITPVVIFSLKLGIFLPQRPETINYD